MIDKITQHIARKDHKCDLCGKTIKPNEQYWYRVSNYDDFVTEKFCVACKPIMDEFWSELDCGDLYDMAEVREWVQESE